MTKRRDFAVGVRRALRLGFFLFAGALACSAWGGTLQFSPAELRVARERLSSEPEAKAWWRAFSAQCDADMKARVPVPARGGQWWHYYFCKDCNERLRAETATRHVCPKCRRVYTGWPYDDAVLTDHHRHLGKAVRDAGLAFLLSDNERYVRFVREVLLDYAEKYPRYKLHDRWGGKGRSGGVVASQALDDAVWLSDVVLGYDAVADRLSAEERDRIARHVLRPEAAMLMRADAGVRHVGNHPCWHVSAVGLVGFALDDAALVAHAETSGSGLDYQLANGVLSDGAWFELAWGYHFYTLSAIMPFYRAKRLHGGALPEALHKMLRAPIAQVMSGWHLPANGDTATISFAPGAYSELYSEASRWWPDDVELAAWATAVPKKTKGYALWGHGATPVAVPQIASACLEGSGLAALRVGRLPDGSPRTSLAFDFGPHGGWHGHMDKLSYELWHKGACASDDPGCGSYATPVHFAWLRQALAHNTVSVDGRGQQKCTGKLLSFRDEGTTVTAVASAPVAAGVEIARAVSLSDGLVLELTWTTAQTNHVYDWAFHATGGLTVSVPLAATSLGEKIERTRLSPGTWDDTEAYTWLENTRKGAHEGVWRADWTRGAEKVTVRQVSSAGELFAGRGWGRGGRLREDVVFNRVRGTNVCFATVISLGSQDVGEIRLSQEGAQWRMAVTVDGTARELSSHLTVR